jgi:mitochondrial fission protein ELM1
MVRPHARLWGITSGQAGMAAQVRSLALALALEIDMKTADIAAPFRFLPNALFPPLRKLIVPVMLKRGSDGVSEPFPDMVISCGRRAALIAMGLKSLSPATRFIHIQDPQMKADCFDLVVAMAHDRIEGDNVIKTRFALHAVTPALLQSARVYFNDLFAPYAAPRIAVLFGGSTNKYRLTRSAMLKAIDSLKAMLSAGGSLLITPSRRTGEANLALLREAFAGDARVYIYDLASENPYHGMLAWADAAVVTNDSVNMMSEAQATGKPLYILPLSGHRGTKPARFAQSLLDQGVAREFMGAFAQWEYSASNEMQELAGQIRRRLSL